MRRAAADKLDQLLALRISLAERFGQLAADATTMGDTDFNVDKPWEHIFEHAPSQAYWTEAVKEPAWMVIAKIRSEQSFLNGDACIAGSSSDHLATSQVDLQNVGLNATPLYRAINTENKRQRELEAPAPRDTRCKNYRQQPPPTPHQPASAIVPRNEFAGGDAKKIVGGSYVANGTGHNLCDRWQNGGCTKKCPQDNAQQCSKCLQNNHGAYPPKPNCPKTPGGAPAGGAPKGRKGQGKAKKGRR